ncbi:MAG: SMR family transporter, partial [Burkholderiaceae bacterium]
MLDTFAPLHALMVVCAIFLEVGANLCMKYSNGFRNRALGCLSIGMILGAFSCLFVALQGIELSIAYAVWGGFGVLATALASWVLFGQRIR